ncbi:MAG: FMN-binding protein [Clostridia bacterium]|nr:FMN-binding protein [Clostridia bacterium]
MKNLKPLLFPTLALFLIGVVVTAALSVTNYITKDRIAAQEEQAIAESMNQLFPNATFDCVGAEMDSDLMHYVATTNGKSVGHIIRTAAMGYKSKVEVLVAFDLQQTVSGVVVTHCADESPGIGQKVGTDQAFLSQYKGYQQGDKVDAITGATYSSDAVTQAVNQAITYMQQGGGVQ